MKGKNFADGIRFRASFLFSSFTSHIIILYDRKVISNSSLPEASFSFFSSSFPAFAVESHLRIYFYQYLGMKLAHYRV